MVSKFALYIIFFFPFWMLFTNEHQANYLSNSVEHHVFINHPGEKKPIKMVLIEVQNENGLPTEYYMDVESVICLKKVCKVIPVRLFWNNIGDYKKYELKKGATLEKYEADLFESADYDKLQHILSNSNSPFKDVSIGEILTVGGISDDIDAVSGATALELNEQDIVPGAALTCYTLWHWANGNVVSIIKETTGKSVSNSQLLEFLKTPNRTYFNIALKELTDRALFEESYIDAIFQSVFQDNSLLNSSIKYLESAPSEIYFSTLKQMVNNGSKAQKIAALKLLQNTKRAIFNDYWDTLVLDLNQWHSFQEISMFLELMQLKNPHSKVIINQILPLLESDIIIARRVYWYLKDKNLEMEQKQSVRQFYEINKNKL
jgi:hypothetical protein